MIKLYNLSTLSDISFNVMIMFDTIALYVMIKYVMS